MNELTLHGYSVISKFTARNREHLKSFTAPSRYDGKNVMTVRFLTQQECKELSVGAHSLALGEDGRVARVKITSLKTWKTRTDVEIGWKFGLYTSGKELITEDEENKFFVKEV